MKTKNDYHLVLVDGSSYLFRAYHALPDLISSKGQPTGAIKGTISMIRKLMSDYPDSEIVVVFDAKGKTFRNEIYSEYKANRPAMPEDFKKSDINNSRYHLANGIAYVVYIGGRGG